MSDTTFNRRETMVLVGGVVLAGIHAVRKLRGEGDPEASEAPAPGPPPPRDRAPRVEGTHTNPLRTWALSPDGRTLATGAEADFDHADDAVEGVVLWDLASGSPLRAIHVPGGVGLCDQLRGAIRFSGDGALLSVNGHTNGVFVARVGGAAGVVAHYLTANDGPPQHVLSADGAALFVEDYGDAHLGGVVPAEREVPPEQVEWLPAQSGTLHVLSLDRDGLAVLQDGALRTIPRGSSAMAQAARLMDAHRLARQERGLLAVAGEGVALLPRTRKSGVVPFPTLRDVEGFAFSTASEQVLALAQSRTGARAHAIHPSGTHAPLDRALTRIDWQLTPDLLPAAPSPGGGEALLLGEDGALELWALDQIPAKRASLGDFRGLLGVLWPQPERAVLAGPTQLVFLEMPSGKVLRTVGFPEGER